MAAHLVPALVRRRPNRIRTPSARQPASAARGPGSGRPRRACSWSASGARRRRPPRARRIDDDQVGRRARRQRPTSRPRISAGGSTARGTGGASGRRRCGRGAARRRAASPARRAVGGLGEGLALGVDVLRVVARHDDVDGAVGDRRDHGQPVVLGAQRRRQLEEGAVGADVVLVQRQVVDRPRRR
jgi:hypothetical protein